MPDVHVVPSETDGCEIGGKKRSTHHTRRSDRQSRHLAEKNRTSELVVDGQDGSIRKKDSHGNDPRDIPGLAFR